MLRVSVGGGDCSSRRFLVHCAVAHLNFHRQRPQLAALVAGLPDLGVGGIDVHHRGVLALLHQHGIGMVGADAVGQQHPFQHIAAAIGACGPPACQLALAVEEVAEELETLQETVLGAQGAVVGDTRRLHIGGFEAEIVEVAHAVVARVADDFTTINGRYGRAACDVAIEHTGEDHRLLIVVGGGGGLVVVTHDAADVGAAGDGGVGVAVDHTGGAVELAHEAADIARAPHRAGEDADVVDAGRTVGGAGHGTHIGTTG